MSWLAPSSQFDIMGDGSYQTMAPSPSASSPLSAPPSAPPSRQSNEGMRHSNSTTTPSRSSPAVGAAASALDTAALVASPSLAQSAGAGGGVAMSNPPTSAELLSLYGPRPVRAQFACDYCRRRKAKCSGTEPCTRCQAKGRECVFSTVRNQRKVTTSLRDIRGEAQSQSQMGRGRGSKSTNNGSRVGRTVLMSQGSPSSSDFGYHRQGGGTPRFGPYPQVPPHYHAHSPQMYGGSPAMTMASSSSSAMWSSPDSSTMYPYTPSLQGSPGLPIGSNSRFFPYYDDAIPHGTYPMHPQHAGLGLFFDGTPQHDLAQANQHLQVPAPPPPPPAPAPAAAMNQYAMPAAWSAGAAAAAPPSAQLSSSAPAITTTTSSPPPSITGASRPHHLFTPNGARSASYQDLPVASTALGFRPPTPPASD
ncbi:hypothetical protein BDZ90DRAFT_175707 [Jaminaea rosea]|uniref:Zn(2)-C6 fungal-type domain-containing protein n=1 Tax=Jaminaea rosea TaxID=1569628 RepID=A0A316UPV3_9BASI|nr:hypothetical protein BDZ90DRAFT_175707 [Jaminaea rosea]PWN27326.1 hypothetical protein BDZ90DRAFT_175707 [Jaminaea rosea]